LLSLLLLLTYSRCEHNINLSKIEPLNKMMKNAIIIKQLIDATSKKEKQTTTTDNNKNWFEINKMQAP